MARFNKFDNTSAHDSGVMIFAGYVFEWRIEYRAADDTGISPDSADPAKTFRVLTLYAVVDGVLAQAVMPRCADLSSTTVYPVDGSIASRAA